MIAYNEEKFIKRAIESVQNQTERNIELYIRNNGSTDNTGKIIKEIAKKDCRIHLVENKINWKKSEIPDDFFVNESGAMDIWPIDKEKLGDYVSFIDADDQISPNFVEELLRVAVKNDSQITVCGNYFVTDSNQVVSTRLPPNIYISSDAQWQNYIRNYDIFVSFYNVFRTHWGKLFEKKFFLKYYNEAWQLVGGRYGAYLDTVVMLRYLQRTTNVSCVPKPLYLFTMGAGSTYTNISQNINPIILKSIFSESLFEEGLNFLRVKNAETNENISFLYQLNWAFTCESIEGINNIKNPDISCLDRIIMVLNNSIASKYLSNNTENVYAFLEPLLNSIWEKNNKDLYWYIRYPMRLLYLRKLIKDQGKSSIIPVIFLGIVCDIENANLLGLDMVSCISEYYKYDYIFEYIKKITLRHNCMRNGWIESLEQLYDKHQRNEINNLENELKIEFNSQNFEKVSEIIFKLSEIDPLNRDLLYYRIQMLEIIGEYELAVILSASARVLFGLDYDMQCLSLEVLGRGKVNE